MHYRIAFSFLAALVIVAPLRGAEPVEALPGTQPLAWEGELADRMMDGLHRYIERKIADSVNHRAKYWNRDFSSPDAYARSIEPNRARFKKMIGVVDERLPPRMERWGDDDNPALVAKSDKFNIYQVRWPVLDGVWGEGLLLEPVERPIAHVIALPDADLTPEQFIGLGSPSRNALVRLAARGVQVLVPTLVDRSCQWSGNPQIAMTNQPHREWIYRQAYQMGRHIIGYEVQKVLAAVDWLERQHGDDARIVAAGYGEGGMLALYSAAVDQRIDECYASGYFGPHVNPWDEPIYRNVFGLYRQFDDAEIVSLVGPRHCVIEEFAFPAVDGPPTIEKGRRGGAAVGRLTTPNSELVLNEFRRARALAFPASPVTLVSGVGAPVTINLEPTLLPAASDKELERLAKLQPVYDARKAFNPRERQRRQVKQLEEHVQKLVRGADATRDAFFMAEAGGPQVTQADLERLAPKYRNLLWDEIMGRLDDPPLPLNPRSRKIYDRERWTGYDVVLDVFDDVFAWGVLLIPKDLKPGERRPVVVCQHGRNGTPKDTIEGDHRAYHDYAAKLADRGYIVFSPHNPYRGEDRYRILNRKANAIGCSLFSFILAQHEQILNYLETLPFVDQDKIAFYGLSYGGETAVRIPPLLTRYCLSICSADFNDWARKVASTDSKYSFMFTIEWEMPYFNLGSTFNYAEMASLMIPRPFMVERGHNDQVAPDEWVAYEYAKVKRRYDEYGLGDKTEIEFFNGPHTINGVGTFKFLDRHLNGGRAPSGD